MRLLKAHPDSVVILFFIAVFVILVLANLLVPNTASCHGDGYQTICQDSGDTWSY